MNENTYETTIGLLRKSREAKLKDVVSNRRDEAVYVTKADEFRRLGDKAAAVVAELDAAISALERSR